MIRFTDHIVTTARSCRFTLYNIRKIRLFLSEQAAQLLFQALVLSRLDYSRMYYQATATDPECSRKISRYSSLHHFTLVTRSRSHQIQGTGGSNWRCTNIPKLIRANLFALQKLVFCNGTFPLRGTTRFGTACYGMARLGLEWGGLFTCRYSCAASTAVTSS